LTGSHSVYKCKAERKEKQKVCSEARNEEGFTRKKKRKEKEKNLGSFAQITKVAKQVVRVGKLPEEKVRRKDSTERKKK
jgi:hypothetical protein